MTYRRSPLLLGACLLLLPACPSNGNTSTTTEGDPTGTTASNTTGPDVPTTTLVPPTTGDTTTGTTGTSTGSDSGDTTNQTTDATTGTPIACSTLATMIECVNNDACKWSGVVSYTYSAQGCQGSITNFCVDKTPSGAATAWYRPVDDTPQVLEFMYAPDDLGPEWAQCDCNGPLACLCTSVTEDCPERLGEFCNVNITALGCSAATFKGNPVCSWLQLSPEGPADDTCAVKQKYSQCLPAMDAGSVKCEKSDMPNIPGTPYENCNPGNNPQNPVYWRDNEGTIELVQICGPVPLGFTRCEPMDTVDQPDECGCLCM